MTAFEMKKLIGVRPFRKFSIYLVDQKTIQVEHPEQVMVGPTSAVILMAGEGQPQWEIVALDGIVRAEMPA